MSVPVTRAGTAVAVLMASMDTGVSADLVTQDGTVKLVSIVPSSLIHFCSVYPHSGKAYLNPR